MPPGHLPHYHLNRFIIVISSPARSPVCCGENAGWLHWAIARLIRKFAPQQLVKNLCCTLDFV